MQIKKSKRNVVASKSFETLGLEPRQRTSADGKTWWVAYDTVNNEYSTLTQLGKYETKRDCQYAIDKYKAYLSKTLGRNFANSDNVDACGDIKFSTATDKALKHIKAAIDILATEDSEVAKDSIANLATVMFDIKGSTEIDK